MQRTLRQIAILPLLAAGLSLAPLDLYASREKVPEGSIARSERVEVSASFSGVGPSTNRSASPELMSVVHQEISRSVQTVTVESNYRRRTLSGRGALVASSAVTYGGILYKSILPAPLPEDGWASQLEWSLEHSIDVSARSVVTLQGRYLHDSVFRTHRVLPRAAFAVDVSQRVRCRLEYAEFMSGPWIGSRAGSYRFRSVRGTLESVKSQRLRSAGEVAWTRGVPVSNFRSADPPPFAGGSALQLQLRAGYVFTSRLSTALGARASSGFALYDAREAPMQAPQAQTDLAVRYDLSWLVRDLAIEGVVQNILGSRIRDYGGGPTYGRAWMIRVALSG